MVHSDTDTRDIAALAWAKPLGGNTIFKLVPLGGKFRFREGDAETFTKTSERGWFQNTTGRKFRTGVRTAVYSV